MSTTRKHLPPKFQKTIEQFEQVESLLSSPIGKIAFPQNQRDEMKAMKAAADDIIAVLTRFDDVFRPLGWIVSESTNLETARKALQLVDEQKIDEAEQLLCSDFEGDNLDFLSMRLRGSDYFFKRENILNEAFALTKEKRYLAAIPLILLVADGAGQDIFGLSIFREGLDLSEMNAIAGHSEGLQSLTATFARRRQAFNDDEITIPYRNGILHGRDNNYGNRLVVSKAWSYLSCVRDIVRAREDRLSAKPEPEISLKEAVEMREETRIQDKMRKEWSPRPKHQLAGWTLSIDPLEEANNLSPEATLKIFLKAWSKRNYGEMGKRSLYYVERTVSQRAGEIRECMEGILLHDAEIIEIVDEAAYETSINCRLVLTVLNHDLVDFFKFRVQYVDKENLPVVRGHKYGNWQVVPGFIGHAYDLKNKVKPCNE